MNMFAELNKEYELEDARHCPFCGNDYIKVRLELKNIDENKFVLVTIKCKVCHTDKSFTELFTAFTDADEILDMATTKWNIRHDTPKADDVDFYDDEKVIYTPEHWEVRDDNDKDGCTGKYILDLCEGDIDKARRVYDLCYWQFPETVLDEMKRDEENLI